MVWERMALLPKYRSAKHIKFFVTHRDKLSSFVKLQKVLYNNVSMVGFVANLEKE